MNATLPFDRVFEDHDGSDEDFPSFLLVNHGQAQLADERPLAWAYAQAALRSVAFALENTDTPEAAYPALFLARHALELYLKGLVPDWDDHRGKANRHRIDYLVEIVHARLAARYHAAQLATLSDFLKHFEAIDPKAMSFRFSDGAAATFGGKIAGDPEIWVDFVAFRDALSLTFEALDRVWLDLRYRA